MRAAKTAAADLERGRRIYNLRCYYCHGYNGDARTRASVYLKPPPRDFTRLAERDISRERMIEAVARGTAGSAMRPFAPVLSAPEIAAVVDFIRVAFIREKRASERFHTAENGWSDHERYRDAFPFVRGELPVDLPAASLSPAQQRGRQLFLTSCITCHDRTAGVADGPLWDTRPVSFPRSTHPAASRSRSDELSGASPYARHDVAPVVAGLNAVQRLGEALYQANCAFCHAADGSGANWIGRFLEPHARDLTDPGALTGMTRARLRAVIRDGVPGTAMSAWKHVLSDPEIDAVIAYIGRAFAPAAAQE